MDGPWTKKELAQFSTGANSNRSPTEPAKPKEVPMGEMQGIDDGVTAQQKSNLADPAVADRLAKMAAQRRAYYGQ